MCSIYETKKVDVFALALDTCLLDTENAMESLGGSYRTILDTTELICQLLDKK